MPELHWSTTGARQFIAALDPATKTVGVMVTYDAEDETLHRWILQDWRGRVLPLVTRHARLEDAKAAAEDRPAHGGATDLQVRLGVLAAEAESSHDLAHFGLVGDCSQLACRFAALILAGPES